MSTEPKYTADQKFVYFAMFVISIVILSLCIATGNFFIIAGGALFTGVTTIACLKAIRSD